jgi:hypothetical protein
LTDLTTGSSREDARQGGGHSAKEGARRTARKQSQGITGMEQNPESGGVAALPTATHLTPGANGRCWRPCAPCVTRGRIVCAPFWCLAPCCVAYGNARQVGRAHTSRREQTCKEACLSRRVGKSVTLDKILLGGAKASSALQQGVARGGEFVFGDRKRACRRGCTLMMPHIMNYNPPFEVCRSRWCPSPPAMQRRKAGNYRRKPFRHSRRVQELTMNWSNH